MLRAPLAAAPRWQTLLIATAVLLFAFGAALVLGLRARAGAREWVLHTQEMRVALEGIRVSEARATLRFVAPESPHPELAARDAARAVADYRARIAAARALTRSDLQRRLLDSLHHTATAYVRRLEATTSAAAPSALRDSVRWVTEQLLTQLVDSEVRWLAERTARLDRTVAITNLAALASLVLAGALAVLALVGARRAAHARAIAEAERDERDRRIALAFAAGHMGWWALTPGNGPWEWSPECGPVYGKPRGWVPRSSEELLACIHPDDRAMVAQRQANALAGREAGYAQYRAIADDGSTKWIACQIEVEHDVSGGVVRVSGLVRDITEAERSRDALARLSLVAERATDAVIVAGPEATIEWVNEAFVAQTGFARDEVIGRRPGALLHGPATDTNTVAAMREAIRAGVGYTGEVLNYTKDGRPYWNELAITPVRDAHGAIERFISVSRDVTQRRELLERLSMREAAVLASIDGITRMDHTQRITFANDAYAHMCGYPDAGAMIGVHAADLHDAEEYARIVGEIRVGVQREGRWRGEVQVRRSDGTRVPLEIALHRMPDGGSVSVIRDLREQKRAEAALHAAREAAEAANQAKSAFLARMSHELRTPLNAIIGFTKVVAKNKDAALGTRALDYLGRVEANGLRLLSLVNDILDLAKVEAGKLEVHLAPTDLDALVSETVTQCEGYPRQPGVQLRAELPRDLVLVETDGAKLRQVLVNLLSNALKFTERGSVVVRVHTDDTGHPTAIDVEDTGRGIAPDRLEAIFEAFEQAEATTARDFGGTGLGLSISRALCRALGAELGVESVVGEGTTFRIELPRAA